MIGVILAAVLIGGTSGTPSEPGGFSALSGTTDTSDWCESFPPRAGRPDPKKWCAYANANADKVWEYRQRAKALHVTIFVGFPVPCPAGAELPASWGDKGIYILRSQAASIGDYGLE